MTVLSASRVVTGENVLTPGWVELDRDRIVATGPGRPRCIDRDLGDAVLVSGFVDMHVHGGGGGSFSTADPASALLAVQTHRRHGTTTTMASLVTASPGELLESVTMLADLFEDGDIAGIHLEGPWISGRRPGAHDPLHLRDPDPAEIAALLAAGRGAVHMVTLAPELSGGYNAVGQLVEAGVTVAVGHTDATYEIVVRAIAAGAWVGTHLFNAMRPVHQRNPGPVVALLEDPRATVELIADGVHLHQVLYRCISAAIGAHRVALVTDAMTAAGLGDGRYQLGRMAVDVVNGTAHLAGSTTIAGSTTAMDQLFQRAVRSEAAAQAAVHGARKSDVAPGTITDGALLRAVRLTSINPARALGLTDVGGLRPGSHADMVVLEPDLEVLEVIRRGTSALSQEAEEASCGRSARTCRGQG